MKQSRAETSHLIPALLVGIFLAASSTIAQANDQPSALPVFPRDAARLSPIELSDFIVRIMPSGGVETITWDYLERGPIAWITEGYETQKYEYGVQEDVGKGLVRIRVNGQPSTSLRRIREELAWTFGLVTTEPPKFGPKFLRLEIGPPGNPCFGALDRGCTFTAAEALSSSKIKYQEVCQLEFNGHPGVYQVVSPDRQSALLAYFQGGGSGGTYSTIEIHPLKDRNELCTSRR